MTKILIKTPKEAEEFQALLSQKLPQYRQAYSDRTAWLMACLSELSYVKFNPILKNTSQKLVIEETQKFLQQKKVKPLLKLIELLSYDPDEELQKLYENVRFLNLSLVKTFDVKSCQAILLTNAEHVFLAFRGTESTSIEDIKSDAKAATMLCDSGGKIHSGFNESFNWVFNDIYETLQLPEYSCKPLFITGHSLGGAIATVAAKKLNHSGGVAACYTFGSPRVGDALWAENIKTPIYRVVNAADPVTMFPPGAEMVGFIAWLCGLIPHFGKKIKVSLLSTFGGYYHVGDMRYLTNCQPGGHKNVKLLYSVSWWFRVKAYFFKKLSFLNLPADHSISVYRNKLKIIAEKRNNLVN